MKIIVTGHVDHGKSTLIGRLMYETGAVPEDKLNEIRSLSKDQNSRIDFAYLLDYLKEERDQNVTIETTQTWFRTKKREYTVIDAPGHVEFIRNMITGASRADMAVLIVDALEGCREQTKRHAYILSMMGIKEVILVINKMDLVTYEEESFLRVKQECTGFLEKIAIRVNGCIPISAADGDNIAKRSANMEWYHGNTLLSQMDEQKEPEALDALMVFPVQDVYRIDGRRIIAGRVESGCIRPGLKITILPGNRKAVVKTVEKMGETLEEAWAGESIGITTQEPAYTENGTVITDGFLEPQEEYRANIFWIDSGSLAMDEKIELRCLTQSSDCVVTKLYRRINTSSLEQLDTGKGMIGKLEMCEILLKTQKPVVMTSVQEHECLGRFVLVRGKNICGYGIVI